METIVEIQLGRLKKLLEERKITLELDPRRVLDRFLEAAADVAQAELEIGDEAKAGLTRELFELGAMLQKPGATIVPPQLP